LTPRRLKALALTAALLAGSAGCSYLKWRQDRSEGLAELEKEPSLILEKEVLPENCFQHGPSPAGDGTIALASQLDPRAQAVATGMSGYGQTHVGILSDRAALEELSLVLDAACDPEGAAR
jgi:hypothetical protein